MGVEEENSPSVQVERVRGDIEIEDATRGIRVADVDARDVVAAERVLLDEDVLDHRPTHGLVGVDALTRRRSGHVVVLEQVVPDDRLSAAVGEAYAGDVVLHEVV